MKWGGAVVTVVLLVVWIGSGWWSVHYFPPGHSVIGVSVGQVHVAQTTMANDPSLVGLHTHGPMRFRFKWWFDRNGLSTAQQWSVPMWVVVLPVGLGTLGLWWLDAQATRRERRGRCAGCCYDRTGLAANAVCPECGTLSKS